MDLYASEKAPVYQPLAAKIRAQTLADYVGQTHIVGVNSPLRRSIDEKKHLHSMILWGPPGVGKTTLAHIVAQSVDAHFIAISAVLSGVKEIRQAIDEATMFLSQGRHTVLFVDEVHRFNKSQQDAFLPHIESGLVTFIGATTENPSFELNNALLSRAKVYVLKPLSASELQTVLARAVLHYQQHEAQDLPFTDAQVALLINAADGDARQLLNSIELIADMHAPKRTQKTNEQASEHADRQDDAINDGGIDDAVIQLVLSDGQKRFDKQGEYFYDQISALHKSMRGSDPDAALYWFCRMIDGGCDALYIARRVVRMASEDIGNADPRALQLALNAWDVQKRLGSPEGELAIAQALVYLSCAPKSNAVYTAFNQMRRFVSDNPSSDVPMHLRNAPTTMMKDMGYGKTYKYAHDYPNAYVAGENYFPKDLPKKPQYYQPVERGLEIKIKAKMERLSALKQHIKKEK